MGQFELPVNIREDIRGLVREAYEGKNISAIKDAWQKRHPGQKLDACKWGFKNFSHAMQTVEGIILEKHLEKTLTFLAFLEGSPAHERFIEEKRQREAAAALAAEKTQVAKPTSPTPVVPAAAAADIGTADAPSGVAPPGPVGQLGPTSAKGQTSAVVFVTKPRYRLRGKQPL